MRTRCIDVTKPVRYQFFSSQGMKKHLYDLYFIWSWRWSTSFILISYVLSLSLKKVLDIYITCLMSLSEALTQLFLWSLGSHWESQWNHVGWSTRNTWRKAQNYIFFVFILNNYQSFPSQHQYSNKKQLTENKCHYQEVLIDIKLWKRLEEHALCVISVVIGTNKGEYQIYKILLHFWQRNICT